MQIPGLINARKPSKPNVLSMGLLIAISLAFLAGCVPGFGGKGEPPTLTAPSPLTPTSRPIDTLAQKLTATLLEPIASPSPAYTLVPTTAPTHTPKWTRIPTLTHTYTPTITPTLARSPTATAAPPLLTPGVLDRKDPLSLVRWLKFGLDHQDISYIEPLLADSIWYSRAYSDDPGETLSKEAFISELERRLANRPACSSYNLRLGEISYLEISTDGWNPPWEFEGAKWDYLVLSFSDQGTKAEGLYLFGAFVSQFRGVNDPNETSCR